MRKCVKRLAALVVCAAVAMSMCSCSSGSNERRILNAAESLGIAITKRDDAALAGLMSDEDLGDVFFIGDDPSSDDTRVKEKIASTLSYSVDADSLTGAPGYKSGTVDIVFSYVDYAYISSDSDNLRGADVFERAVDSCGETIEVTLTFDYVMEDDKVTFSGVQQIRDLFPYVDEFFDFTINYPAFVGGVYFAGDAYDEASNTYTDTCGLHCYIEITDSGLDLDWSYYYTIDIDGENVYTSSTFASNDEQYLNAVYTSAALLEEGVYTVTFYSADGQYLGASSAEVIVTVTPGIPGTQDTDPAAMFYDSPYFVCPDDNVITLPDSDVVLTLPDYLTCHDFNYFLSLRTPYTEFADNVVFFATDESSCYCLAMRLDFPNYASQEAYDYLGFEDGDQATISPEFYEDSNGNPVEMDGDLTTIGQYDYNIGGRNFRCLEVTNVTMEGAVLIDYYVVGDDDTCYLFIVYRTFSLEDFATNNYTADDFVPCISVG